METIDAATLAAVLRETVTDPLVAAFNKVTDAVEARTTTLTAAIADRTTSITTAFRDSSTAIATAIHGSATTIAAALATTTTKMEAGFGRTNYLLEQTLLSDAAANPMKKEKKTKRSKATTGFRKPYKKGQKVNMSNLRTEEGDKLAEAAAAEFAIIKPALETGAADSNPAYAAAGPAATDDVTRETERHEPVAAWLTAAFRACGGINLEAAAWRVPPRHSVTATVPLRHYYCVKVMAPTATPTRRAAMQLLQYAMAIGVQQGRGTSSLIGVTDGCTAFVSVRVDVNARGVPTVSLMAPADLPRRVAVGVPTFGAVLEAVLCLTEQLEEEAANRARLASGLAVFLDQCRRLPLPAAGDEGEAPADDDAPPSGGAGGTISGAKRRRSSGHSPRIKVSAEKVARVAARLGPASAALLTLAAAAGIPASRSSLTALASATVYVTPVAAAAPAVPV